MTNRELWSEASRRRLVRLCTAVTGDPAAAEDLAQETLLEGWRQAHKLHDPAGADRWLAAVARNVCRRWARSQGRELAVSAAVRDAPRPTERLEHDEVADLLDLLPAPTREVLELRYVHDLPHRRIGEVLGISEDAVSMRLSRGTAALRTLLDEASAGGGWRETRVWCHDCARRRLVMRREPHSIAFRCPGCKPSAAAVSAEYRLSDPTLRDALGGLVRPAAILRRAAEWQLQAYGSRVGCSDCGAAVELLPYRRAELPRDHASAHGLHGRCRRCGTTSFSFSLGGLATSLPELRRFRREHPRSRLLPVREVEHEGTPALVVGVADERSAARADVVFERRAFRVLHVAA